MTKRKKTVIICLFVLMVFSLIFGFYTAKSGWGDNSNHGIRNIEWVMLSCFILMAAMCLFLYVYYLFNMKNAGDKLFQVYVWNYKTEVKILIFLFIIIAFEVVLFAISPSITSALCIGMIAMIILNTILTLYFINGLFEGGVIYLGKMYTWKNVVSYSFNTDKLLTFKVKNKRKDSIELKYYIKDNNSNEIETYLQELVEVKK